jgi:hypothetical protein
MPTMTEEQKTAVVVALARFKRPSEVAALIRDEFGNEITLRQVIGYNPSHPAFDASDKWREVFDIHRKIYLEDVKAVPISNQAFRINSLQEIHDKAVKAGNHVLAMEALEQAAKEMGGLLTNARSLDVTDKRRSELFELTPEERRERAVELLREALQGAAVQAMDGGPVIEHQPAEGTEGNTS